MQVDDNSNGSGLGALVFQTNVGGNVQVNNNFAGGSPRSQRVAGFLRNIMLEDK